MAKSESTIRNSSIRRLGGPCLALLLLAGCGGDDEGAQVSATRSPPTATEEGVLIAKAVVPPGVQCPNGGVRVDSGIDENNNGTLDPDEVDTSDLICNGIDSLVSFKPIEPGSECLYGGTRVQIGQDVDGDEVLDAAEVSASDTYCATSADAFDGLVFVADKNIDGMPELFRVSRNGATLVKLGGPADATSGAVGTFLAMSPNGTRVAFLLQSEATGPTDLYVASLLDSSPALKVSGELVAGGDVRHAKWSPDGSQIAYVADKENNNTFELYAVFPDGTGRVKLSAPLVAGGDVAPTPVAMAESFAWSADGSRIAYVADAETDGVNELYLVSNNGTNHVKANAALVAGGNVTGFAWAPNGQRLAYLADEESDGVFELYGALADGSSHVKITPPLTAGGNVTDFSWAPDSRRLAYRADQRVNDTFELFSVLPDSTGITPLNGVVSIGSVVDTDFQWSPDSRYVAFRADRDLPGTFELYVAAGAAAGGTKVNGPLVAGGDVSEFAWAPDSSRLAYRADQEIDNISEVYSAFADGSGWYKLNGALAAGGIVRSKSFTWAPDGSRLAYVADQDTAGVAELYSVLPDGSGNLKVNGPLTGNGDVFAYSWSPDSAALAYRADQDTDTINELYTSAADGSANVKVSGQLVSGGDIGGFTW